MAVLIDTVYQRVLSIANKEQRGYITPQEFNLLANQAQMEIFEQYFYDLNQFSRLPGNETKHADMVDILEEKISIFEKFRQDVGMGSGGVGDLTNTGANDIYRLGVVSYNNSGQYIEIEHVNQNELNNYINSPLTAPTTSRPIYIKTSETAIQVYPTTITSGVTCNFIARPADVVWNFTTVLGEALHNSNGTVNFQLHESDETTLVQKILQLAGITIKDPGLYQLTDKEENETTQQEKL
tara:strand:- start:964 stop:1680 length:717 start_codon:yes stop_codon:yes gene_type:complete